MSDLQVQQHAIQRGEKARKILESEEWKSAWQTYRETIFAQFEACKSDDTARLQHLKQLLLAGTAAKAHLERLMEDGTLGAKFLEHQEKRGILQRIFP